MTDQLVKRFVAPTMTRALELVQRELGPEAVILSSKKVDKGVEIITSLEPDLPTRGIDVRREFGQKFDTEVDTAMQSDSAWRSQAGIEKAAANYGGITEQNGAEYKAHKSSSELAKDIEQAREKMLAAKRRAKLEAQGRSAEDLPRPQQPSVQGSGFASALNQAGVLNQENQVAQFPQAGIQNDIESRASQPPTQQQAHIDQLQNDIADMRMLLEQQIWQMSGRDSGAGQGGFAMPAQINMPKQFTVVSQRLHKLGLSEPLIEELMASTKQGERVSVIWRDCMANLSKRIPICHDSVLDSPGVYAFLGQTGVGKTTTIAKLAAQYVLKHGPGKVALVTTDTYRVGAFDQLRTMGRILNVPVRVVDQENSLLTVLASLKQFPLVLIDTAGFRLGDPLLKAQLDQLEASPSIKRVVVLSCNSQLATMKASVHAHRGQKGLHACVLTKLDESASIGEAISLVLKERMPVAYTTDGQDIPHDIAVASGHGLVAKAMRIIQEQHMDAHSTAL